MIPILAYWIRTWYNRFMNDRNETKVSIIAELGELRRQVAELEASSSSAGDQTRIGNDGQHHFLELTAVYRAGQRLQQLHTPVTLAQEIMRVLEETLAYEDGAVLLIEEGTGRLLPFALSEQGQGPGFVDQDKAHVASHNLHVPALTAGSPGGEGITGWVAQHGQSVCVGDVRQDPRYHAIRDDIRSELCVPMRIGDQILGVVNVETTRPDAYTQTDQRVLETVAAQMAVALENARLYAHVQRHAQELEERVAERTAELQVANERLKSEATERQRTEAGIQRRLQEMPLLYQVSAFIASAADITDALNNVCAKLARFLEAPQAGFAILNSERTAAEVIADYHPPDSPSAMGAVIPVADNPSMAYILKHKAPLVVSQAQADPLLSPVHSIMRQRNVQSILIVPVIAGGEVIGTLGFDSFEQRVFGDADVDLVQHVANQTGQVLMRRRAEEEVQRRARETAALYETSLEINSQPDLPALLQAIVHRAVELVGVRAGGLYLMQGSGDALELAVGYNFLGDYVGTRLNLGEGLSGRVAQSGQPMMVADYGAWDGRAAVYEKQAFRRMLGVPLKVANRVIGVLDLTDDQEKGFFDENQVRLATLFADQAAIAVENARLLQAERAARGQTEVLREAAQVMGASLEVNEILRLILDQLRRVLVYDTASVLVLREGNVPDLVVGMGYEDEGLASREAGRFLQQSPILRRMAACLQPVVSPDVRQLDGWIWVPGAENVRSWMAIPLVAHGRLIGVLMVDHSQPGFYGETELRLAQVLAQHAAQALENARLFEAEQQRARELSTLLEATRAVSSTLELEEVLVLIAEQIMKAIGVEGCALSRWEREADTVETWIDPRLDDVPWEPKGTAYALADYPATRAVLDTGRPCIVQGSDEDADPAELARMRKWGVLSLLMLPLAVGGRIIGLVELEQTRRTRDFSADEIRLVQALVAQAGVAIEHARLFEERVRAEREAQERRLYLEAVLDAAPDAIVTLDAQHRLVEWNAGAERLFGYTQKEVIGHSIDDLIANPDAFEEAVNLTRRVMSGAELTPIEAVRTRKDGSPVDVLVAGSPIQMGDELIGLVGVYTDIGERKRAERTLRKANRGLHMLSQCNEALSRARDEPDLLREICQIAVDVGGYRLAWVGLSEQDEAKSVRPVAQAGFEEGYLETVKITWADTERGRGPTGTAIRTGKPAIAQNILNEPHFAPWREEATRRGYASSIALPLLADGLPFGALTVYATEPGAFDAEEVDLLTELADNLAYGIVALRTRVERLRAEEAQQQYAERLVTLHQIDRAILEAQSPEAIAQATLVRLARLVPYQRAHISAFGPEGKPATVLAVHTGDGGRGDYLTKGTPFEVNIPLMAQGELIGTLHLEAQQVPNVFAPEYIEIVYEVAAPLAVAIQHARLHEQLRHHAGSLEETVTQRTGELMAERDRTQAILESLGEAVFVTDADGMILYDNPATVALTGFSSEEMVGQNWRLLLGEGHSEVAYAPAQVAMRAGKMWRGEMVNRRKDKALYDVAVTVTPLPVPDDSSLWTARGRAKLAPSMQGRPRIGSVWVQRDITPLKEAERFKDQFVSNVSHELRTPLSIVTLIVGNLDKLHDRLDDDQRREMIRSIREQVGLLNALIGDVLKISRIDSGRLSMERQLVDLAQLVREEADEQQPLARRKALALRVAGVESLIVQGNDGQLRQAIRNLLNNAIKFTPTGGQIVYECLVQDVNPRSKAERDGGAKLDMEWPGGTGLPPGKWAALRVADTGIGISPEDVPHLFERFFRVKTQGNVPGTGLGLSITRELVELHGGYVALASVPGKGSVFGVYLPLLADDNLGSDDSSRNKAKRGAEREGL